MILTFDPHALRQQPVELPLSKSIALRAMILNAVGEASGKSPAKIPLLPEAEDIAGLQRGLEIYYAQLSGAYGNKIVRIGEGGAPLRFFTALAASTPGIDLTISGGRALIRRPVGELMEVLRRAGCRITPLRHADKIPYRIVGIRPRCREIHIRPDISSQYISALMMAAPLWDQEIRILYGEGRRVSTPYIGMTAAMMRKFGISVSLSQSGIRINSERFTPPADLEIEHDWSAASYFYQLALLLPGGGIKIAHLTPPGRSIQGDSACAGIFGSVGVIGEYDSEGMLTLRRDEDLLERARDSSRPILLDMTDTPDLVPATAVGFALARLPFRIRGIAHLRHKESDRIATLTAGLAQLGYGLSVEEDAISWKGERIPPAPHPLIATASDHRIAMAFAPAAIYFPGIEIENPGVVGKSFPRFWENLRSIGFAPTN